MTKSSPLSDLSLPSDFTQQIQSTFGESFAASLCHCLDSGKGNRSIRLNPYKYSGTPDLTQIPWSNNGYLIEGEKVFAYDPAWHGGLYYVQEAASMFIEQALKASSLEQKENLLCLDLCAAPGGKSTLLSSWLGQKGTLISNEIINSRAEILKENIIKWGLGNTIVTNNDPAQFANLGEIFDLILVDAPCSGEGLFRRDLQARTEWNLKQVGVNVERQRSILRHAWKGLKEGGCLIYSTCTFNKAENEDQLQFMLQELGAEVISIPLEKEWHIVQLEDNGNYRFFPHLTHGEGFALCMVRKTISDNDGKAKYKSKALSPVQLNRKFPLPDYFDTDKSQTQCYTANEQFIALTVQQVELCQSSLSSLYIKYAGTDIGILKQKDFIPAHALSQSIYLNQNAFNYTDVDYEQALAYLSKENILPSSTSEKGLHLLRHKNTTLGFIKMISPTRTNNYYPNEWRIRQAVESNTQDKFLLNS